MLSGDCDGLIQSPNHRLDRVSARNDSKLACWALQCTVFTRGGKLPKGLIHHSDRGSTYASYDYEAMLRSFGIEQSMSAKGNCYDNAAQESFYGRCKTSTVGGEVFFDEAAARSNVFEYIEVFYNRFRKHSSLGYKSPLKFEEKIAPPRGAGIQAYRLASTTTYDTSDTLTNNFNKKYEP